MAHALRRYWSASGWRKASPRASRFPEQFVSDFDQLTYTAFRSAHDASVAYRTEKPTYARLAALGPVPKLLAIFGVLDAIVPAATAKFYEQVPGAKVETIDGVGHSPMVEAHDKTLALIPRVSRAGALETQRCRQDRPSIVDVPGYAAGIVFLTSTIR